MNGADSINGGTGLRGELRNTIPARATTTSFEPGIIVGSYLHVSYSNSTLGLLPSQMLLSLAVNTQRRHAEVKAKALAQDTEGKGARYLQDVRTVFG